MKKTLRKQVLLEDFIGVTTFSYFSQHQFICCGYYCVSCVLKWPTVTAGGTEAYARHKFWRQPKQTAETE